MFPGSQYTLRHDFDNYPFLGRIGIVLREGESFALDGIIGEIDDVSDDCGRFPYYIPSYLADVQRCVGTFNETFTFDDFIDGGSNGAAAAAFTETDCSFEFAYTIEVK